MNLVVGATGLVGGAVCRLLAEQGKPVRAMVRESSAADRVEGLQRIGAETVHGDLKNSASLAAAVAGATTVISTASSTISRQPGDSIASVDRDGQRSLIDAAVRAGVRQFVLISFLPVDLDFPLQSAKRAAEERLTQSGMSYTILQPTCFMEVWLSPALGFDMAAGTAQIYGTGQNGISWISFEDVARAAAAALDVPHARNAMIPLGGPETLSPLDVVSLAEQITGKRLTVQHVDEDTLEAQYRMASDPLQKSFAALMLFAARGSVIDPARARDLGVTNLRTVRDHLLSAVSMGNAVQRA